MGQEILYLGCNSGVDKISIPLEYGSMPLDIWFPVFWNKILISYFKCQNVKEECKYTEWKQ